LDALTIAPIATTLAIMARILIADDDAHIRQVVRFALEQAHHEVHEASNGLEAIALHQSKSFDLLILDVMMPEMDGTDVCRLIRAKDSVPILFLSSRDEEFDRVLGLELGADDYISKPFSPRELVARVKANLRRVDLIAQSPETQSVTVGRLTLDPETFTIRIDYDEVVLTPTEFAVLLTLARRPKKVYSRSDLMQQAYDVRTIVSDRTIDSHVRHVREKFASHNVNPIETVHGVGYRLGDVT